MMWRGIPETETSKKHLIYPGQSGMGIRRQLQRERAQMADNVNSVTDSTFQSEVIDASKSQPVMVDFWAEWCRPCLMLAPTVAEIATAYAGKIKVVKLNVDENTNAAGKFNIRGIPTLLIFKGGQVAEQVVGAVPRDQIEKAVQRHLA
jgi:thioredoxin 1